MAESSHPAQLQKAQNRVQRTAAASVEWPRFSQLRGTNKLGYFASAVALGVSCRRCLSNQSAMILTSSGIVNHGCPPPFLMINSAEPPAALMASTIFWD